MEVTQDPSEWPVLRPKRCLLLPFYRCYFMAFIESKLGLDLALI